MYHIRPYKLFTALNEKGSERIAHVSIPNRRGTGGVSLLEMSLILTCVKLVKATRVFEIGTYLGSTTLNLGLNTPENAEIFTLDLDQQSAKDLAQNVFDAPLTSTHLSAETNLDFASSTAAYKIKKLVGNSCLFDFSSWYDTIDLVFIDGGHDPETFLSDTNNALKLARRDRLSCILWHDYRNPEYPELTACLDRLSEEMNIFHVEDTKLCLNFQGPHDHLTQLLLTRDPA